MNTEFPSRVPNISQNNTTSSKSSGSSSSQSTKPSKFQEDTSKILKEGLSLLDKITTSVNKMLSKDKISIPEKKTKGKDSDLNNTVSDQLTVMKSSFTQLKIITDYIKELLSTRFGMGPVVKDDNDTSDKDKDEEKKKDRFYLKAAFNKLSDSWKSGILSLQKTTEGISSSVGDSISRVLGSGLLGKIIGNAVTKSLTFAVSKVLLGMVVSNLPIILIMGGIVGAIYLIVKYAKEIWDGITWLAEAISQGFDALIDILPGGKSKYEAARNEEAAAFGVTPQAILDYYGNTVRGRSQAYKDWDRAKEDAAFYAELRESIRKQYYDFGGHQSQTAETLKFASPELANQIKANDWLNEQVWHTDDLKNKEAELETLRRVNGETNFTPIVNTNNSTHNTFSSSNNVSSSDPKQSMYGNQGI